MTISTENRAESYKEIKVSDTLGNLQQVVYYYIMNHPDCTDEEISEGAEIKLATVLGRRNELAEQGLIIESGKKTNVYTNRNNTTYRVTNTEAIKMEKITKVSLYGFMVEGKEDWHNYDKRYKGTKLTQEDKGKLINYGVNPAGYVTFIRFESESTASEKIEPKALNEGNNRVLLTKVVTALDPNILEDEVNAFCRSHNVKYNTPFTCSNYFCAYLLYEE